jgi:hypothetical protein
MSAPQLLQRLASLSAEWSRDLERMEQMRGQMNEIIAGFDDLDLEGGGQQQAMAPVARCLESLSYELSGSIGMLKEATLSAKAVKNALSDVLSC